MPRKKKSTNGKQPAMPEMVDLSLYLKEIGDRLITGDNKPKAPVVASAPMMEHRQLIVFRMGALKYAIAISHVTETVRHPEVTPVPGLPRWVMGVCNAHGEIISAVDLAQFLELTAQASQSAEYMLVTHADDQSIGLVVDDVEVIYTFPAEQVVSPPFNVESNLVNYLEGAVERGDGFIRLLNCDRLLQGSEMQQFH